VNSFFPNISVEIVMLAILFLVFSAIADRALEKRGLRFFGLAYAITVIVLAPAFWALSSLTYLKQDAWTGTGLGIWLFWTMAVLVPSALTLLLVRRWKIPVPFRVIAATVVGTVVVPIAPYTFLIVGCTIMKDCI
jgi:hypothetical protein